MFIQLLREHMWSTLKPTWIQRGGFLWHKGSIFQQAEIHLPSISGAQEGTQNSAKVQHRHAKQGEQQHLRCTQLLWAEPSAQEAPEQGEQCCCNRARARSQAAALVLPFPGEPGRAPHGYSTASLAFSIIATAQMHRGILRPGK